MNSLYDHATVPATGAALSSSTMRAEFDAIEAGFDKILDPVGNANKIAKVNSGATAYTASTITDDGTTVAIAALLTASKFNGLTLTSTTGTFTLTNGKTLAVTNTLTFSGTDSTVMTFPATSATIARTDAANTFTGHQTIEGVTSTGATGTGKLVFDSTPTLVTPVLGVATGTSLNLNSSAIVLASTGAITSSAISLNASEASALVQVPPAIYATTNVGADPFNVNGQLVIQARTSGSDGRIYFFGGNGSSTLRAQVFTSGLGVAENIGVASGKKILLDSMQLTGNTYITDSLSSVIDCYANGVKSVRIASTGLAITGTLSATGAAGFGLTPTAMTTYVGAEFGVKGMAVLGFAGQSWHTQNAYYNTAWKAGTTGGSSALYLNGTVTEIRTAPSVAADAALTWSTVGTFSSTGLAVTGTCSATSFFETTEIAAPAAGAANTARIFAVDSGGGKTILKVQFATGAAQTIATEP